MNRLFTILNGLVLLLVTLQVSAQGTVHSDIDYKDDVIYENGKDLLDIATGGSGSFCKAWGLSGKVWPKKYLFINGQREDHVLTSLINPFYSQ